MSSSQTSGPLPRHLFRRVIIIAISLLCGWHIFATFLWIAPPSGLRQIVPGTLLHDYMIPMNGQSWSVFAPNPINGDYRLQVRAVVQSGGGRHTSDWVDATAAELSMLRHHLFPPRAAVQSTVLASEFKSDYDDLSAEQKKVVALGYYKGEDWEQRLRTALLEAGPAGSAERYLVAEHRVTAYASQVAYAAFGDGVVDVQFIVSRQNVIPYSQRNNPDARRPPVQPAPTGWRGLVQMPGQSRADFAAVFRPALRESGQ